MGLDTVEFVLWAEKEFGVEISDQELTNIYTVGEFANYIANKVNEKKGTSFDYLDVFPKILAVLESDYGVDKHKVTFNSRFVQDLGLD
jgi:acyl carrier protein